MSIEPRETLERRIRDQLDAVVYLTDIVEESILDAVRSLSDQDLDLAKRTYEKDLVINEKRYQIERDALATVAMQQPIATDLRKISSIIDLAGELERIGDYAKGIARITLRLGEMLPLRKLTQITEMARITAGMLHRAVSAFVALDEETARSIPREDDQVDYLYNQVYQELIELMIADRDNIGRATFLLWAAHNLERAADRVTNICERTVFTATGRLIEFDRSDDETEAF